MSFYPNKTHQNAMAFCLSNGVTIIPELLKKNKIRLNVRVEANGMIKNIVSPKTYTNDELWQPIYEIYLAYFKKMADKEIIKKASSKYLSFI